MSKTFEELRLEVCNACNFKIDAECALCGCTIADKVKIENESCPHTPPKWISAQLTQAGPSFGSPHPNAACGTCTKRK